jgi:hypothetical protein
VRSEGVAGVFVHEGDFPDEFVDELGPDHIEGTLRYFVEMVLSAVRTVLFPAREVEKQNVGVLADDGLG